MIHVGTERAFARGISSFADFTVSNPPTLVNTSIHSETHRLTATEKEYSSFLDSYRREVNKTLKLIDPAAFWRAIDTISATVGKKRIFTAGNGGSATTAEHFAHNLNWDVSGDLPKEKRLSAICLNSEMAEVTARSNDRHFAYVFASQLEHHADPEDVFIGISASGNSDNIVKALLEARSRGLKTIFIGRPDSKAANLADLSLKVNSKDQQIVEDVSHILAHQITRALAVKLHGLGEEALMDDLAHLKTKATGTETFAARLGSPVEQELDFERGLTEIADIKIANATTQIFPGKQPTIEPFATDYTSFIRHVATNEGQYLAKFSFGRTKPRVIQEHSQGRMVALARLAHSKDQMVSDEFHRALYLRNIFPELIPVPCALEDGVAFHQFIEGASVEKLLLKGEFVPMAKIGRLLKDWHDYFQTTEPPEAIQVHCDGAFDRIRRFQTRYSTPDGINRAFRPLFDNGHLDSLEADDVWNKISNVVARINSSPALAFARDTWGHGDFKPENVLVANDGERVYFVDNDFHKKPGIVDVAKMVSRTVALGLNQSTNPDSIIQAATLFLEGYMFPSRLPDGFLDVVALDTLTTLSAFSPINKESLTKSPFLAQVFLNNPKRVIDYMSNLVNGEHPDLESATKYF